MLRGRWTSSAVLNPLLPQEEEQAVCTAWHGVGHMTSTLGCYWRVVSGFSLQIYTWIFRRYYKKSFIVSHIVLISVIPRFPQDIFRVSARNRGISMQKVWNTAKNVVYPLKYHEKCRISFEMPRKMAYIFWNIAGTFCLAIGNIAVISVRHQLPFFSGL
jgi:hypothetical protein